MTFAKALLGAFVLFAVCYAMVRVIEHVAVIIHEHHQQVSQQ